MRTFAVIGLGRFGTRLAEGLAALGRDVIAVDRSRARIEHIKERVGLAVALDATDEEALRAQGVHKVDAAIVAIAKDFEANLLATVILKQLGVPRVISRATSDVNANILRRVGADVVVNPELEAADRWANRLIGPEVLNLIEFHEGYSVAEVPIPRDWVGKSLSALGVRAQYGLHVVAVRRSRVSGEGLHDTRVEVPGPDEKLQTGDVLILMGRDKDIAKLPET